MEENGNVRTIPGTGQLTYYSLLLYLHTHTLSHTLTHYLGACFAQYCSLLDVMYDH
jgi:hypothetical protein